MELENNIFVSMYRMRHRMVYMYRTIMNWHARELSLISRL